MNNNNINVNNENENNNNNNNDNDNDNNEEDVEYNDQEIIDSGDDDQSESLILKFCKMHGSANDFIIFHIDHLRLESSGNSFIPTPSMLQKITQSLCNRTTGVGADQVLIITPPPENVSSDYHVLIFNSDGSIAENCANGLTCVTKFIIDYDILSYKIQQQQQTSQVEPIQHQQQQQSQQTLSRELKTYFSKTNSIRLKSSSESPYKTKQVSYITINTIAGIQHCYSLPQHLLNNSKTLWVKVSMGNPLVLRTNNGASQHNHINNNNNNNSNSNNNNNTTYQQQDIDMDNFIPYSIFNADLNNHQQQMARQDQRFPLSATTSRRSKTLSINSQYEEYSKMIQCGNHYIDSTVVSMGNPHCVLHLENVEEFPLDHFGKIIETHPLFPEKTNVEFAQVKSKDLIRVRVWQRGCGVTSACGTGAAAVLVSGVLRGKNNRKATIVMDGGHMEVEWREHDDAVFISAPAVTIFEGSLRIFMDELK